MFISSFYFSEKILLGRRLSPLLGLLLPASPGNALAGVGPGGVALRSNEAGKKRPTIGFGVVRGKRALS